MNNIESITIVSADGKIYTAKGDKFEEITLPETIEVQVPEVTSGVTGTPAPTTGPVEPAPESIVA